MAKGNIAKSLAEKKIIEGLGPAYIGTYDKKIYAEFKEDGQMVQVAISMTCPKVPIEFSQISPTTGKLDFEQAPTLAAAPSPQESVVEISDQEKKNIEDLMARLGL